MQIPYKPTSEALKLLETFRHMVNYRIHVDLEKNVTSRFKLSKEVYNELTKYGLHSWYVLGAQDERPRFSLNGPADVAVSRPLNKAASKSGGGALRHSTLEDAPEPCPL